MVAITLRIPPYPPEDWITTSVYGHGLERQYTMPWSSDVPGASGASVYNFDLSYYAHMCRVRQIHAKILTTTQTIASEARAAFTEDTRAEVDQWSQDGQIYGYGYFAIFAQERKHIDLTLVVLILKDTQVP